MKTLPDIFNLYKVNVYPYQEKYYDWYRKADNLRCAIYKAFISKNERGKVESHQCRVGCKVLGKAAEIALEQFDRLSINNLNTFNNIYQFVDSVRAEVKGFGLLATYDVSLRIAKYQRCDIYEVYCHRGVTVGARALGFDVKDGQTITVDKFPTPLNQLSADHLENLLCIYRDVLANTTIEVNKACVHPTKQDQVIKVSTRHCC